MKINRDIVLHYLKEKQEKYGGYFGTDLSDLAEKIGVSSRGLRRHLSKWIKNIKDFSNLIYLGKRRPPITHNEFFQMKERLHSNSLEVKSHILFDLQNGLVPTLLSPVAT